MAILIDFDILQQQLSMIAFSYALIFVFRLRYPVEEHSGKILAPGSEYKGNSSVTHVTFFQFFYFHQATIKHLVDQSNKFKAYDDLGVQFYITT